MVIRHGAPTLAGLKTGNMFTCRYPDRAAMTSALREWNRRLRSKGVRVIPLRYRDGEALIYFYRPAMLKRDMKDRQACTLLEGCGYRVENCNGCIARLRQRLSENGEFPHEVGLFLGYPPEDVDGFIRHNACGCKCIGCWKVYGDKDRAEKLFSRYKRCTEIYRDQWSKGTSIERLTVTV